MQSINLLVLDDGVNSRSLEIAQKLSLLGRGLFDLNIFHEPMRADRKLNNAHHTIVLLDRAGVDRWRRASGDEAGMPGWACDWKFCYLLGDLPIPSPSELKNWVLEIHGDIPLFMSGEPRVKPQSAVKLPAAPQPMAESQSER